MRFKMAEADIVYCYGNIRMYINDFKNIRSLVTSIKKDMDIRIGLAWNALNKMEKV